MDQNTPQIAMSRILFCLVSFLILPSTLPGEQLPPKVKEILKSHEEQMQKLSEESIRLLDAELKASMRAGNLEEANAIKAKQDELAESIKEDSGGPSVREFISDATGKSWKLDGSQNLKRIQFDGKAIRPVDDNGKIGRPYETRVESPGVIVISYNGGDEGWFLFSPDLTKCTSLYVSALYTGKEVASAR